MAITVEGFDELAKYLEKLSSGEKLEPALQKSCALVERSAKQKAPKGSGDLRRSITSKVENNEGIVYTPLHYAPYVEYGTGIHAEQHGRTNVPWKYKDAEGKWHTTSGMSPHPYMRPAMLENRDKIVEILKEGLLND